MRARGRQKKTCIAPTSPSASATPSAYTTPYTFKAPIVSTMRARGGQRETPSIASTTASASIMRAKGIPK